VTQLTAPRAARAETRIERARRILSEGPRPDDYLVPLPEFVARADEQVKRVLAEYSVVVTPEARQWMIDNDTLRHYYEGREVLTRRTGSGVVVLAAGDAEVTTVLESLASEHRARLGVENP
jgi:hypothetical protein